MSASPSGNQCIQTVKSSDIKHNTCRIKVQEILKKDKIRKHSLVWNEMIDMSNDLRNTQTLDIFVFCHKPNQKKVVSYQN